MLLKLGTAMMVFAVAFALFAAILVNISGAEEPAAPETAVELQRAEATTAPEGKFDLGERLEIDEEPREKPREEPRTAEVPVRGNKPETIAREVEPRKGPPPRPPEEPPAKPRAKPTEEAPEEALEGAPGEPPTKPQENHADQTLPISPGAWPRPSREEVAAASGPRHYPWQEGAVFTLTIEALEIYDAPVLDSTSPEALNSGVVHIPETPMPWEEGQQKNVYLAGHRVGYPGTASRVLFYHLDKLSGGDSIVLEDRAGNAYTYRVSEMFVVEPSAGWVLDPVRNRDMVTLQTCTYPTFENRLIVRADRV